MNLQRAQEEASKLGMSAWLEEESDWPGNSRHICCIGFVSAGIKMAEGKTWERTLDKVMRLIYDIK